MAKKKKASKKGRIFSVVASVLLLVVGILSLSMLATPLFKSTSTVTSIVGDKTVEESQTAYEFMEEMNKEETSLEDKDAKTSHINNIKITIDTLKENGAEDDDLKYLQNQVAIYDTILIIEILSGVALGVALLALILLALNKGTAGFILNLIAVIAVLAIFICACITMTNANALCEFISTEGGLGELISAKTVTQTIAPIAVLVISLIGTLLGGTFTVLGKKK